MEALRKEEKTEDTAISEALALASQSSRLKIVNDEAAYKEAAGYLILTRESVKALKQMRKAITDPLDKKKKEVMGVFKPPVDALETAKLQVQSAMNAYRQEIERKRLEDERRRLEEERKAREAEEQRQLMEAKAIEFDKQGEIKEAVDLLDEAKEKEIEAKRHELMSKVSIVRETPKAQGTSFRKFYSVEVLDENALIKAVMEGKAPADYLSVNLSLINAEARKLKDKFIAPDGVRLVVKESVY